MKILFVTGNKHKVAEAQAILKGFTVEAVPLDIPEIQSLNPGEIIRAKLAEAKELVEEEGILMVDDVAVWCGELGFPGPLVKYFLEKLGKEGMLQFCRTFEATAWRVECQIGLLLPGGESKILTGEVRGEVVDPRGESGFGFDPIFQPEGYSETFAEMGEERKNELSHRGRALESVASFLKEKF